MYAFGSLFPLLALIPKILGIKAASNYSTRPVGFPYHVEYYVDLEKYFYPILIHNYISVFIRLTIVIASDTLVAILVQHCCALFSIVRYDNSNQLTFWSLEALSCRFSDIGWSTYESLSNRIKSWPFSGKMIRFTRISRIAFENTKKHYS